MIEHLHIELAISAIRSAFEPFVCIVERNGSDGRLSFHVFGSDGQPLASVLKLSMSGVTEPATLRAQIQDTRARLQTNGLDLKPWKPRW